MRREQNERAAEARALEEEERLEREREKVDIINGLVSIRIGRFGFCCVGTR